ncbi:diphosphomevalonate decarboxylase-like isoform X1 [Styela clava]
MSDEVLSVTVTAPTNIAIVKYWGKRCTKFNLPINSSLSATLSQDQLKTTTRIETSPTFEEDEVWLHGKEQDIQKNQRLLNCFNNIRRLARKQAISGGEGSADQIKFYSQKVQVHTENNFPTAAGLASSASGYAALVFGLGTLFKVQGDLTSIARQGSGSACRSLHGGFVEWQMGEQSDGEDSIGVQIAPESHWPELRIIVLVVNDARKKVGSTEGMQSSVQTSTLLQYRSEKIVDERIKQAKRAIIDKDFSLLAEIIMKESNQLHAVCLDSFPPLHYLSNESHTIMDLVHAYNKATGCTRLAYTFDAGPNACLFTMSTFVNEVAWLIEHYFPVENGNKIFRGLEVDPVSPGDEVLNKLDMEINPNVIKYAIHTRLGHPPKIESAVNVS